MFGAKRKVCFRKLTIIHYANVNLYPPIQNLLAELLNVQGTDVELLTGYDFEDSSIKVVSPRGIFRHSRSRFLHYAWWHLVLIWKSSRRGKKSKILLYEANSYPALLCLTSKVDSWLHFHEYRVPNRSELSLFEWWSEMQIRRLIQNPTYVSHVTDARRRLLLAEGVNPKNEIRVMWNCPRREWAIRPLCNNLLDNTVVLVGAVGRNTWSSEVMQAFEAQTRYTLHVYGKDEFESTEQVKFCGWTDYSVLPDLLLRYRVGLVWYNNESVNATSSIPNKIFEYLHCGLQIIASRDLVEAKKQLGAFYANSLFFVDFENANWMEILDECFREGHMANNTHDFSLCVEPLLDWIEN